MMTLHPRTPSGARPAQGAAGENPGDRPGAGAIARPDRTTGVTTETGAGPGRDSLPPATAGRRYPVAAGDTVARQDPGTGTARDDPITDGV